tara:strand:- start:225 stop:1085 length:861 start_codon:yes stop_codon:yes gene_type:complete
MKLRKTHWIGIGAGAVTVILDAIFFLNSGDMNLFIFILGIGLGIALLPFIVGLVMENKKEQKINEMFLEFSRNLAENVAAGTPISKSVINMRNKNYGVLTPYVQKLANQISLGIPVETALETFAEELDSKVVKRAIALIREAERAGGEIDYILESTAKSIAETEKLKKEVRASMYNLVVQGYIIFFIFIGIMLVMEFKILPLTAGISGFGELAAGAGGAVAGLGSGGFNAEEMARPFLYLLITQGLFAGLVIGKLAEGSLKAGIKHSFILMIAAFLVSTGARVFLG